MSHCVSSVCRAIPSLAQFPNGIQITGGVEGNTNVASCRIKRNNALAQKVILLRLPVLTILPQ